jgi:hypothetical protein
MEINDLNRAHVEWSREHFRTMADGGVWAIPRSGMIFRRRGDTLVLSARMPHDPAMPLSAAELDKQQHSEFEDIKRHFEAAGVKVFWES